MNIERFLKNCPCGSQNTFQNCCKPKKLDGVFVFPEGQEPEVLPDWRIAAISQIVADVPAAYPGGPSHKKGSYVTLIHHEKDPQKGTISFTTPHAAALSLGAAVKNSIKCIELKDRFMMLDVPGPSGQSKLYGPDDVLFDYLECSMASVNFSFQALESFCNSVLARADNVETLEIKDKKETKNLNKKEIERNLSTEDKLTLILPKLLNVENVKSTLQWHHFKQLKDVRDSIVHMKSYSMFSKVEGDASTLYFKLIEFNPFVFPKIAFELIWFYSQSTVGGNYQPPWAKRFLFQLGNDIEKYVK